MKDLTSRMEKAKIIEQVASMRCLVAFIKADNFPEAMDFAKYVNSLPGNPVKNRKKYVILMTPAITFNLLRNQTGNVAVHIISPDERGREDDRQ